MNGSTWRRARRTALVVACLAYFATISVIGQVADGNAVPETPTFLLERR
jgi:hypothetical protein